MLLALLLFATACPAGQTQVYGTGTGTGTITIYPKDKTAPKTVKVEKGVKWTVCLAPTPKEPLNINDEHFNPWYDEVHSVIDGKERHMRWQIPSMETADSTKLETDGELH
jgi:hypothetical protein